MNRKSGRALMNSFWSGWMPGYICIGPRAGGTWHPPNFFFKNGQIEMWTEPRIDNLLLTIVPHQPRMFRSSAVPWALQLTCGQSIMISLSQLPPAQSLSAVAVTLYARARIVKRAGIVRLCPTLH